MVDLGVGHTRRVHKSKGAPGPFESSKSLPSVDKSRTALTSDPEKKRGNPKVHYDKN